MERRRGWRCHRSVAKHCHDSSSACCCTCWTPIHMKFMDGCTGVERHGWLALTICSACAQACIASSAATPMVHCAGVTFAWGGSRAAVLQSALGLGAMSYVLEKMGGGATAGATSCCSSCTAGSCQIPSRTSASGRRRLHQKTLRLQHVLSGAHTSLQSSPLTFLLQWQALELSHLVIRHPKIPVDYALLK